MLILLFMDAIFKFRQKHPVLICHNDRIGLSVSIKTIGNQIRISYQVKKGIFADSHKKRG